MEEQTIEYKRVQDEEIILLGAIQQIDNITNLLYSNEYKDYIYQHLLPVKYELERQLSNYYDNKHKQKEGDIMTTTNEKRWKVCEFTTIGWKPYDHTCINLTKEQAKEKVEELLREGVAINRLKAFPNDTQFPEV